MVFRYPGSKSKLLSPILERIGSPRVLCDLFVGGGSVATAWAEKHPERLVLLNDLDSWMYCFWHLVSVGCVDELVQLISVTQPSVPLFQGLRANPPTSRVGQAFCAVFFNRTAFSGILRSGPIGGFRQTDDTKYKIDCRWNSKRLIQEIGELTEVFTENRCRVTNVDAIQRMSDLASDVFIYADPPYFKEGAGLYRERLDHEAFRDALLKRSNWLLSYDNCHEILELYKGCRIEEISVSYTAGGVKQKTELLISP